MKNYFAVSAASALLIASGVLFVAGGDKTSPNSDFEGVSKFSSEKAFKKYVSSQPSSGYASFESSAQFQAAKSAEPTSGGSGGTDVSRSSDTNIQVQGVHEPDILKNTGEKIYYSSNEPDYGYYWGAGSSRNASVFSTLPAENFSEIEELPEKGKMFLAENSVIFLGDSITSYSRDSYEKNWELGINSSSIVSARKINSSIYLVLRKQVDISNPCPVRPMKSISIPCTEFYRPASGEGSDTTYTVAKIDAQEGKVTERTGFVGSGRNTVVYVSKDSIYLTYYTQKSRDELLLQFLEDRGSEFLDEEAMNRINEIQTYNLSEEAKMVEIQRLLQNYRNQLPEEKQ
ncbi:MAG: beta-propeller domain-containing protein, partial [Candidatus Nanohalobium sp.]